MKKTVFILLLMGVYLQGNAQKMALGANHRLSICTGKVRAAGANFDGVFGDGTSDNSGSAEAKNISNTIAVAAGYQHSMALLSDGTVWSWGVNGKGQLGDGTYSARNTPVKVKGLTGITKIAAGNEHSLALKNDSTVWTWGFNEDGQLGDGTKIEKAAPVKVSGLTGIIAISGGYSFSIALKKDGTVYFWGWTLGNDSDLNIPVKVSGLNGIIAIAAGQYHALALKKDGSVWSWGSNSWGELGNSSTIQSSATPVQVSSLSGIIGIASGFESAFSLAVKSDGTAWSWGNNNGGQLGDGTTVNRNSPVKVTGLSNITQVLGGPVYALGLKNDGTTWGWGATSNVLGKDFEFNQFSPKRATDLCTASMGVENTSNLNSLLIYPNPSSGKFLVELPMESENLRLEVYTVLGEKILNQELLKEIDISRYPKGIYFAKIYQGENVLERKLIVD